MTSAALLRAAAIMVLSSAILFSACVAFAADGGPKKPKKPVTVTSDTMEANTSENRVVFRGNVVAVEDFTLCSDELNILYDDKKEVSEIEASGNVRIFQRGKESTSDKAVYDRTRRKIVLTGKPEVRQCSDTVKGDRITVNLDDDNALVEGGGGGRVKAVIMPEKKCPEGAADNYVSEEARCNGTR